MNLSNLKSKEDILKSQVRHLKDILEEYTKE